MLKKLMHLTNDKAVSVELKVLRNKSMANQTSCMLVKHKEWFWNVTLFNHFGVPYLLLLTYPLFNINSKGKRV